MKTRKINFPEQSSGFDTVLNELKTIKENDTDWKKGRVFGYIYQAGEEESRLVEEAYRMFMHENALNPSLFNSLKKFESEVVSMTAGLLHGGPEVTGSLTSGGTESILMAVKTARDRARHISPQIKDPEIILPVSAHPAFDKAAHYLGVKTIHIPVGKNKRADTEAMEGAISSNTILLVGSAPCFPHGVIDPIEEIGQIALRHNISFHVDSCLGGFMLPFVEKLGYPVPPFDFRVAGVTSISADVHKYGYSGKGASVVLYAGAEWRKFQYFAYADWPGGLYGSPTMLGTKCGGPLAAAWAIINYMGEEKYLEKADLVMKATKKLIAEINGIPGLQVVGEPDMSVFAFTSDELDIFEVGDQLGFMGWHLDRLQFPNCLHMTVSYYNAGMLEELARDLRLAVEKVRQQKGRQLSARLTKRITAGLSAALPESWFRRLTSLATKSFSSGDDGKPGRSAAMYGITATLDNRRNVKNMIIDVLDEMYR